ncbi:hypothetical protein [Pantoea agglomerans]|uniref:hypothetical protein n=1 Tax=Enterobacter agglomerans TaxID=549 RepID=UPI0013C068CF|nr:hypothetical protein [Pantoea agglomerans]NEH17638.1 hypothetical protein [Pantoea agglomerans]
MKFVKWLGKLSAHLIEGMITVVMSFVALASLFVFDSLALKICVCFGAIIIGYAAAYYLGMVRGEHKQ